MVAFCTAGERVLVDSPFGQLVVDADGSWRVIPADGYYNRVLGCPGLFGVMLFLSRSRWYVDNGDDVWIQGIFDQLGLGYTVEPYYDVSYMQPPNRDLLVYRGRRKFKNKHGDDFHYGYNDEYGVMTYVHEQEYVGIHLDYRTGECWYMVYTCIPPFLASVPQPPVTSRGNTNIIIGMVPMHDMIMDLSWCVEQFHDDEPVDDEIGDFSKNCGELLRNLLRFASSSPNAAAVPEHVMRHGYETLVNNGVYHNDICHHHPLEDTVLPQTDGGLFQTIEAFAERDGDDGTVITRASLFDAIRRYASSRNLHAYNPYDYDKKTHGNHFLDVVPYYIWHNTYRIVAHCLDVELSSPMDDDSRVRLDAINNNDGTWLMFTIIDADDDECQSLMIGPYTKPQAIRELSPLIGGNKQNNQFYSLILRLARLESWEQQALGIPYAVTLDNLIGELPEWPEIE